MLTEQDTQPASGEKPIIWCPDKKTIYVGSGTTFADIWKRYPTAYLVVEGPGMVNEYCKPEFEVEEGIDYRLIIDRKFVANIVTF